MADHDQKFPLRLWGTFESVMDYIKDDRILVCPLDNFPNGASYPGVGPKGERRTSYHTLLTFEPSFMADLSSRDPNPGVVVCLLHCEPSYPAAKDEYPNPFNRKGSLFRARLDTSVTSATPKPRCLLDPSNQTVSRPQWTWWDLFSDVEPSQEPLNALTGGLAPVACP